MKRQFVTPFGVLVLYNASLKLIKGEPNDFISEYEVLAAAEAITEALTGYYDVVKLPISSDVELVLAPYPPTQWVIFNLAEGLEGRLFECSRITWAIEAMGYCYTGANGETLSRTTNKALAKHYLTQAGIPTPHYWTFCDPSEVVGKYDFPLIVKPIAEDGSLGIGQEAVVQDIDSLKAKVQYIIERYHQVALAEKFISGREINIAIWGDPPQILPMAEIDFDDITNSQDQIVSYAAKWETESFEYQHMSAICPAIVDDGLASQLTQITLDTWNLFNCKGYARVDVRVDENGLPYVIDINCNPDLALDAGFFRSAQAAGFTYRDMAMEILNYAIQGRFAIKAKFPIKIKEKIKVYD